MLVDEFDYPLPKDSIAQRPLSRRDASRLMTLTGGKPGHHTFADLPSMLRSGDVLVLNDSKVISARLHARKSTGGRVEILLLSQEEGEGEVWDCVISGKTHPPGTTLRLEVPGEEGAPCRAGPEVRVTGTRGGGRYTALIAGGGDEGETGAGTDLMDVLRRYGEMPTPPYIRERLEEQDRYQTVYAREVGSVAAPTAGFHFTPEMLDALAGSGVHVVHVTLHVGISTFATVRSEEVEGHAMEPEWYRVPGVTADAVNTARAEGRRVVYVGTTTMKTMESAAGPDGAIAPGSAGSDLFIHPGHRFRAPPDLLLTNFHLPRSTLLMLVAAYAGKERILDAYEVAVRHGYRFYSFGDAMLLSPSPDMPTESVPPLPSPAGGEAP
jgi:S-adenosylmethionine:tRNA ribosyltransferase-isomerase